MQTQPGTGVGIGATADGRPAHPGTPPRSVRVACGGFHSTREIKRFGSALATDIMTEKVGHKPANGAIRSLLMSLRAAETECRYGGRALVIDDGADADDGPPPDPIERRRQELLEELAALDKERAAG